MAFTTPTFANMIGVADGAIAAGQPVTSEVANAIQQQINHLIETLHNKAVPGASSATVAGHQHTGADADSGHSIPRMVYGEVWSLPLGADPAVPSPVQYDFGDDGEEQWVSLGSLAHAHNTPGWLQSTGSTGASTANPNLVKALPFRLRAGCTGVRVFLWRGVEIGSPPNSATEITWRLDLRSLVTGDTASGTILDSASYAVTASENAQWVQFPGTQPDASVVNGDQSGETWLACTATPGERLTADANFLLYIGFDTDSNNNSGGTNVYLYGALVYEVSHEEA